MKRDKSLTELSVCIFCSVLHLYGTGWFQEDKNTFKLRFFNSIMWIKVMFDWSVIKSLCDLEHKWINWVTTAYTSKNLYNALHSLFTILPKWTTRLAYYFCPQQLMDIQISLGYHFPTFQKFWSYNIKTSRLLAVLIVTGTSQTKHSTTIFTDKNY